MNTLSQLFAPASTNLVSTTEPGSYVPIVIAAVIGITLIILVIITIVQMQSSKPKVEKKGPFDLFKATPPANVIIDRPGTFAHMAASYTLAFYIRIDAVPDMRSGGTSLITWPGVWNIVYNASQEQLIWQVNDIRTAGAIPDSPEQVVLPSVPMQKWVQITLCFEGRTMDLFVNGVLVKSHTLGNIPNSAAASITIVPGGIMGQIAYIQLWPRRFTVSEVGANFTDTSDSQGRPYLGPEFLTTLNNFALPNLFCPSGNCTGSQPAAKPSQTWEFPYA